MTWIRSPFIAILLVWLLGVGSLPATAATNSVFAGIGGINNGTLPGGDGTGTARFTIHTVPLALVQQARDLTGTPMPDGSYVSSGQEIYFVFYVDNTTAYPAVDIRITDLLNESQFTYIPESLETTLVPSGSSDAEIWAGAWTPLTDQPGGTDDIASATDSGNAAGPDRVTVGAVPEQPNQQEDIPGLSLRAVRFRVEVN